ncbi:hypothetical protein HMI56_007599 [Coelomomyces lativittatus]|nr:hypothetical protein HMI56_007599 [Coelomomyces lativittatus]
MDCFTVSTDEVVQVLMLESMALLTWYPTFKLWLQTKQAFLTYLNHQTTLLPTSSVMCVSKVFAILISLKLNQPVHPSTWVSFILPSTTQSEVGPTTNPTTSTSWMIGYLDSFLEALSFIGLQPSGLMYLAQQPNLFWTTFIQLLNQPTLPLFHPPYFPSFASSLLTLTYHLSCDEPSSSLQTHPNNNNTTVTHDTHSTWRTQLVDQLLDLQWYTCLSKVAKLHRPWTQLTQSQLASLAYTLTQTRPRCAGFMRQGGLTWLLRLLPRLKACQALMLLMIHLDPRLVFPSTSDLMAHVLPVLALRGFLPVTSSTQEKGALFGSTSSASIGTDDETSDPFFNGCVPSTQELRIQGYMALTNVVSCLNFNDAKGIKVKHWIKEVLHLDFFHPDPEVQVCVWECVGNFLGHPQVENGQDANDEHEEIRLFFSSLTSPPDPPTDPWPACLVHTLTSTSTSLRMKRASSTLLALTAPFLHHHDTWDRLETVLYTLHEPSLVHRWVHAFATSSNLACSGSQKKRVALWVVSKFGQENPFSDLVEALLSHST